MNKTTRISIAMIALAAIGSFPLAASAALVNFGDISDPAGTVVFEDVTEENVYESTLYVPDGDSPVAMGNNLILDPSQFIAEAAGGESEITDSELSFTIAAEEGSQITSFSFSEAGSATLAGGLIGGAAGVQVSATVLVTGAIVDGEFVDLNGQFLTFNATNDGVFELPEDQGTNQWAGSATFYTDDVFDGEVTSLSIVIDNTLLAEADDLSSAFIDKKEISISVGTDDEPVIPEPTALGLLATAAIAAVGRRARG